MDSNQALFSENYAAAQSLKNGWTRLASTHGLIRIALSPATLTIEPHWYAKGLLRLLDLDLCHEIPVSKIRGVAEIGKWFSYSKVELQFETEEGDDRRIVLYMKKYLEFIEQTTSAMHR
jgi:hypothetical protein